MTATIVLLGGDGIGPEVVREACAVLDAVGLPARYDERLIGGAAIDATGCSLPAATVDACRGADAVLLGAVGGPKWDDPRAADRPERGLLAIRKALGLYANLRPITLFPELADASPLKADRLAGVDILFVRELTGGLYFGEPRGREGDRAVDTCVYTVAEVERVVRLAFRLAAQRGRRVTSVDKANVLETSRLWRETAVRVAAEYPGIALEHQLVDSCAMRLVAAPSSMDVVVTENMFGDILTDEASVLTGSLGMLPSASLGDGAFGLYEPVHGSAPDIAGKGIANPCAAILSAAMMLRHSLGRPDDASRIERAVRAAIAAGARTADLGGAMTTAAMGVAIRRRL
jgi:3-isopropylmalate dehydrogenase